MSEAEPASSAAVGSGAGRLRGVGPLLARWRRLRRLEGRDRSVFGRYLAPACAGPFVPSEPNASQPASSGGRAVILYPDARPSLPGGSS